MIQHFRFLHHKIPDTTIRANFIRHLIDGSLFIFAMSFVSVHTIIPVFLKELGASSIVIGLFPALWSMGLNFPQLFITKHQPGTAVKPALLKYGLLHRIFFLFIGLYAILFATRSGSSLAAVLIFLFLTALFGARAIPAWVDMFSKTVPVQLRGRLIAYRQFFGSFLGAAAGVVLWKVLDYFSFPINFGVLFLLCFSITAVSFYFIAKLEENSNAEKVPEIHQEVRSARTILKQERNFRNFLFADALYGMGFTANTFYAVYAINTFQLSASASGMFTIITMGAMTLSNPLFGYIGDKYGHRINLLLFGIFSASASVMAVVASGKEMFGIVFFLMASAMNLQGISRMYFTVELCQSHERQKYVSLLGTVTSPVIFFGIINGWLISLFGYHTAFITSAVLMTLGVTILYFRVNEPRKLTR